MSFYSYSTGVDLAKLYVYLHGLGKIIPKKTGLKIMVQIPPTHSFQIQAFDALKEVHEAGFLHQDVKPVRKSFKHQANFVLSHDQNKVCQRQSGIQCGGGCGWVEGDASFASEGLDIFYNFGKVGAGFDVNRDIACASFGKLFDIFFRIGDHEMHIQWKFGGAFTGLHEERADGDSRDEVAVHDVHVEPVGTGGFAGVNLICEAGEI